MTIRITRPGEEPIDGLSPKAAAAVLKSELAKLTPEQLDIMHSDINAQLGLSNDETRAVQKILDKLKGLTNEQADAVLARLRERYARESESGTQTTVAALLKAAGGSPGLYSNALAAQRKGERVYNSIGGSVRVDQAHLGRYGELDLSGLTAKQTAELLEDVQAKHPAFAGGAYSKTAAALDCRREVNERAAIIRAENKPFQVMADAMATDAHVLARDWHAPTLRPQSAANLELLVMNFARFAYGFGKLYERLPRVLDADEQLTVNHLLAQDDPVLCARLDESGAFFSSHSDSEADVFETFAFSWLACAFARLEVGHRFAASLCLTDVPDDIEVAAPWPAWSLLLPEGLFGAGLIGGSQPEKKVARVWCMGVVPVMFLRSDGTMDPVLEDFAATVAGQMLSSLIKGACLALSNPSDFEKKQGRSPTPSKTKGNGRKGPPELGQARFLLSAPVKVDFRAHVAEVLTSGRRGASPTVQFLVRGHWKQQAHGPRHSLRKTIFVEGFWKGPEESRVLLRQHKIADGD